MSMETTKRKKTSPLPSRRETLAFSWHDIAKMNVDNACLEMGMTVRDLDNKIKELQKIRGQITESIEFCVIWGTTGNMTTRRLEKAINSLEIALKTVPWARQCLKAMVTDYDDPEDEVQ